MKLKDYVTLGNLACGFSAVIVLFFDYFDLACYLIYFGFVFDVLDGLTARLTKQYDKFGAELDNLCDLFTYSVAPSFILYYAFAHLAGYHTWIAASLGFVYVAIGTVRAARYNVRRAEFPGFFIGLPRPVAAMALVALLQSAVFKQLGPLVSGHLYLLAVGVLALICWAMMTTVPFIGHHGRKFKGWIRFGAYFFLISVPVSLPIGFLAEYPPLFFDVLLFNLLCYLALGHFVIPRDEARGVREFITRWKAMDGTPQT
jgi:CDP-diacylglycerol--serine O-phosphatidyltransferase